MESVYFILIHYRCAGVSKSKATPLITIQNCFVPSDIMEKWGLQDSAEFLSSGCHITYGLGRLMWPFCIYLLRTGLRGENVCAESPSLGSRSKALLCLVVGITEEGGLR